MYIYVPCSVCFVWLVIMTALCATWTITLDCKHLYILLISSVYMWFNDDIN